MKLLHATSIAKNLGENVNGGITGSCKDSRQIRQIRIRYTITLLTFVQFVNIAGYLFNSAMKFKY